MLFANPNLLSNEDIREELTCLRYPAKLIDSIIEKFWFHDPYNSFIAVTKHFELLKQFLKDNHPDTFSRFDFYEFFFDKIFSNYEKLRTTLHQLGLIFEQMQSIQMDLNDLIDILKRIDTSGSLSLDVLKNRGIISLSEKDGV